MIRFNLKTSIYFLFIFWCLVAENAYSIDKVGSKLTDYINPLIGTSKKSNGNTFPGATTPFGMVQLTPATCRFAKNKNTYQYDSLQVTGFVSTILSGTGGSCLGDGLFMPWCGNVKKSPGKDWYVFSSKMDHSKEKALAGYYGISLQNDSVQVELTATKRTGIVKFSNFKDDLNILINPSLNQNVKVFSSSIEASGNQLIKGMTHTGNFWNTKSRYTVYFVMQFSRPFEKATAWTNEKMYSATEKVTNPNSGMFVTFDKSNPKPVLMKIGISYVSTENAMANIKEENAGWNFDNVRQNTVKQWEELLNRVKVESDDYSKKTVFYTALYHAFMHPNVFSDANGDYIGFDNKIYNTQQKYTHYTNFSGWDVYRNQMPLLAMLTPEVATDFAVSMTNNAKLVGAFPKWSVANDETGVMIGDPATATMSSLYAFGVRNFDYKSAYQIMLRSATQPGVYCNNFEVRPNLDQYIKNGFIAEDNHKDRGSVSISQEYNIADYALSRLAFSLNDTANAQKLQQQSYSWRRHFNKEEGFLWPILSDGTFIKEFNPNDKPFARPEIGFCEANSYVYTLMIPHDFKTVVDLIGGNEKAMQRIKNLNPVFFRNEPAYLVPWLYNYLGEPHQTQKLVRELTNKFFIPDIDGIPGNDDLGQMSAWCIHNYFGLFPALPGSDKLLISSPFFKKIIINNRKDKKILISSPNVSESKYYIGSLFVNGKKYNSTSLNWSDLGKKSRLVFEVSNSETSWGK